MGPIHSSLQPHPPKKVGQLLWNAEPLTELPGHLKHPNIWLQLRQSESVLGSFGAPRMQCKCPGLCTCSRGNSHSQPNSSLMAPLKPPRAPMVSQWQYAFNWTALLPGAQVAVIKYWQDAPRVVAFGTVVSVLVNRHGPIETMTQ